VLGRRKGTTLSQEEFLRKHKDIVRQLKTEQSLRNAAKITGKGISTVQRVKAALSDRNCPKERAAPRKEHHETQEAASRVQFCQSLM